MEVEGEDGSKIVLQNVGDKVVFGRGFGFNTKDKTVSRRHVVFELAKSGDSQTGSKVSYEVVGKNPMWVREHGSGEIWVSRRVRRVTWLKVICSTFCLVCCEAK